MDLLAPIHPYPASADAVCWWRNDDGIFTVKSVYSVIRDRDLEVAVDNKVVAFLNKFWKSHVPSKIKVFGWRVLHNRLPSKDQLVKRGIINNSQDKWCVLCMEEVKDLNHLLFKCGVSLKVWSGIFAWLGLQNMLLLDGVYHLEQLCLALKGRVNKKKLCNIWLATVWTIWNTSNKIIFNEGVLAIDDVTTNIKVTSWIWQAIGSSGEKVSPFYNWYQAPLISINVV
ncbi:uncharacterized protein LOC131643803 [Vicia villosa]|uniref:uncharacterized protein LOC131643803 n=1 Tax=Vicia villosa TaxID=3911 RepID=UPI00273BDDCA|nr:uncharacterized protein LOC131643803 [Vicia villosa]